MRTMCINNGFQKTFQNVCIFPLSILKIYYAKIYETILSFSIIETVYKFFFLYFDNSYINLLIKIARKPINSMLYKTEIVGVETK